MKDPYKSYPPATETIGSSRVPASEVVRIVTRQGTYRARAIFNRDMTFDCWRTEERVPEIFFYYEVMEWQPLA